jgi:hypothetical protein
MAAEVNSGSVVAGNALMVGVGRHTPEGVTFKRRCEDVGWKQPVRERDAPNNAGE